MTLWLSSFLEGEGGMSMSSAEEMLPTNGNVKAWLQRLLHIGMFTSCVSAVT